MATIPPGPPAQQTISFQQGIYDMLKGMVYYLEKIAGHLQNLETIMTESAAMADEQERESQGEGGIDAGYEQHPNGGSMPR